MCTCIHTLFLSLKMAKHLQATFWSPFRSKEQTEEKARLAVGRRSGKGAVSGKANVRFPVVDMLTCTGPFSDPVSIHTSEGQIRRWLSQRRRGNLWKAKDLVSSGGHAHVYTHGIREAEDIATALSRPHDLTTHPERRRRICKAAWPSTAVSRPADKALRNTSALARIRARTRIAMQKIQ